MTKQQNQECLVRFTEKDFVWSRTGSNAVDVYNTICLFLTREINSHPFEPDPDIFLYTNPFDMLKEIL